MPKASRPRMPKGYQIAAASKGAGLFAWGVLVERMTTAHNYWVATTRPDGRPHVMPVWGIWLDDAFVFGTDRGSRKARNLSANLAASVHVERGDEATIVEGVAERVTGKARIAPIDVAYRAKYKMRLTDAPGALVIYRIRPRVAFAWREQDFNACATRWTFDESAIRKRAARGAKRTVKRSASA